MDLNNNNNNNNNNTINGGVAHLNNNNINAEGAGHVVFQLTHTLGYTYAELTASPSRVFLLVAGILIHFEDQIATMIRRVMIQYHLTISTCQMGIQVLFGQMPNAQNVVENEEDLLERIFHYLPWR